VSAPPLIVVTRTAQRRHVAEVVGTPLWSAGPSPEYAVGALVLQLGWRFGLAVLAERSHAAGFCAVPVAGVVASRRPASERRGRNEAAAQGGTARRAEIAGH